MERLFSNLAILHLIFSAQTMAKPLNNPSNTQQRRFAKLLDVGEGFNLESLHALCELNLAGSQALAVKKYGQATSIYTKALDKLQKHFGMILNSLRKKQTLLFFLMKRKRISKISR